MKDFKDYITDVKQPDENIIKAKRFNNGLATFVYGAGDTAAKSIEILRRVGVEPVACFVDDEFFSEGKLCSGVKVISLTEFKGVGSECNVLIGLYDITSKFIIKSPVFMSKLGHIDFFVFPGINLVGEVPNGWVQDNSETLSHLYDCLRDDLSRKCLLAFLRARTGEIYAPEIPPLHSFNAEEQYFNSLYLRCELPYCGEVFVDCGAYDGDTVERIAKLFRHVSKIYAFEPDKINFGKLKMKTEDIPSLVPINKGVWSSTKTLRFVEGNGIASRIVDDGVERACEVNVASIDDVLAGEKASFIKMDVEGAELEALKGAENTISTYMPMLAVCAYHKIEDLVTLQPYIESIVKNNKNYYYEYYIRHHSEILTELVLYAVPRKRRS